MRGFDLRRLFVIYLCASLIGIAATVTAAESEASQNGNIHIAIDRLEHVPQGHYAYVSVRLDSLSEPLDSLSLCIACAKRALTLMEVRMGDLLVQNSWTSFNYDVTVVVDADQPDSVNIIRVAAGIGIADNSASEPTPIKAPGELVVLKFYVSNDGTFEDTIIPLRFVWESCNDNVLHLSRNSLNVLATHIYETGHRYATQKDLHDLSLIDDRGAEYLRLGGPAAGCVGAGSDGRSRNLSLSNGYIAISYIGGWMDAGGDLNMNGRFYEQDDLNLLIDYLLHGVDVFDISGEAQVLMTDANRDSVNGTVADLVTMTRIVSGARNLVPEVKDQEAIWSDSTEPWRKWYYPGEPLLTRSRAISDTVTLELDEDRFQSDANVPLGGIYAIFSMADLSGSFEVQNNSSLKMLDSRLGDQVRVILFPGVDSLTGPLPVGKNDLFSISGDLDLKEMQASDYDGNMLYVIVDWKGKKLEFPEKQEE
jgi:hypothetical protein